MFALGGAKSLVCADHVGEQRVTAIGRHLFGVQEGRQRWFRLPRGIGMPEQCAAVRVQRIGQAVGPEIGQLENFRVKRLVILVEHMDFQLAEQAAEGHMRGRREPLVTQHQDAMAFERCTQGLGSVSIERYGGVHALRLDTELAIERAQAKAWCVRFHGLTCFASGGSLIAHARPDRLGRRRSHPEFLARPLQRNLAIGIELA